MEWKNLWPVPDDWVYQEWVDGYGRKWRVYDANLDDKSHLFRDGDLVATVQHCFPQAERVAVLKGVAETMVAMEAPV